MNASSLAKVLPQQEHCGNTKEFTLEKNHMHAKSVESVSTEQDL